MSVLTMDDLVVAVRQYAVDHYSEGWDVVVEIMDYDEIVQAIGRARTEDGAVKRIQRDVVDLWVERQANAGVPEATRELEIGRQDTERAVYQGLVEDATDPEVFGVGVALDADAAVLRNPLGHHLPGLALDGPVCGACTTDHNRRFGTRHNRQQLRHVSIAAIRLCAQRRAEQAAQDAEEEQEVNAEYQAELAYERYLENGGRHAAAIQADLEEERRRTQLDPLCSDLY